MTARVRIVVADDHEIMRDGLRRLIGDEPGLVVVGEAADASQLLEVLEATPTDIVLLDLSMPGPGPLQVIRLLQRRHPGVRILVLTMHKQASIAVRLLQVGAAGFICKDNAYAVVGLALRKVAAGGRFIDPDLVDGVLAASADSDERPLHETLSAREFEVLQMMVGGQSLKAIADALCISPKTISTHKARLMEKLRVKTTVELVRYAIRLGVSPAGCDARGGQASADDLAL